jgi:hypothetical protein
MQDHLGGLTADQVEGLQMKVEDFKFEIKQINVGGVVIDRCESCHLGVREPIKLTRKEMGWTNGEDESEDAEATAFVSHPNGELLRTHDPDRFGCSTCHGGNGREPLRSRKRTADTSIGYGRSTIRKTHKLGVISVIAETEYFKEPTS